MCALLILLLLLAGSFAVMFRVQAIIRIGKTMNKREADEQN